MEEKEKMEKQCKIINNKEKSAGGGKHRIVWLDIMKGIAIFLVVSGHICSNKDYFNFVYAFHMAIFFIVSGILFKCKDNIKYIKHKFLTIMVPYYSFGILTLLYWQLLERKFRFSQLSFAKALYSLLTGELRSMDFNIHLWFLPCFFLISILYNFLYSKLGNKKTWSICSVMTLLYIFYIHNFIDKVNFPFQIYGFDRMFKFIGFYCFGNILNEYGIRTKDAKKVSLFISLISLIVVYLFSKYYTQNQLLWVISGGIGTLAIMTISIFIGKLDNIISKVIEKVGEVSLIILCTHGPIYRIVLKLISTLVRLSTSTLRASLIISCAISVMTIFLCFIIYQIVYHIAPWMIGLKREHKGA